MLRQVDTLSAVKAGIFGTVIMTVIMYGLPPLMGKPPMDIIAALGSVFPFKISPYVPGSLVHFAIGIGLTFVYAALFSWWLPGPHWLRGAIFSLAPWLFAITLLGPSLQFASHLLGNTSPAMVANPCAPKTQANPCAATNPCAPQTVNAATAGANPCGANNPCAASAPTSNPCAAASANPCGAAAPTPLAPGAAAP